VQPSLAHLLPTGAMRSAINDDAGVFLLRGAVQELIGNRYISKIIFRKFDGLVKSRKSPPP
jgi:hypothetical protein